MRIQYLFCAALLAMKMTPAQDTDAARILFETRCGRCHGSDGTGGDMGPPILNKLRNHTNVELRNIIRGGINGRMPAISMTEPELKTVVGFLRAIQPDKPADRLTVTLVGDRVLEGEVVNVGFEDMQVRTSDNVVHLLRRVGERFREVTSQMDWPEYNGDRGGNRYTAMSQITPSNVSRLGPKWMFTIPNVSGLQVTPVVVGGMMYVAVGNDCYALDAGTGRQIWHYRRAKTVGAITTGVNRGAVVSGDRVFMQLDAAHMIALNRQTGSLVWDTTMADWHQSYFSTSAPLTTAGNLVIGGVGGGEHGSRGFVAAYDQSTGKEAWRFWTIPAPGEKGSETWKGKGIAHGGAPTWFTGTYDVELDTVYWPTGNPSAEYNGDDRLGDNLYSDCILALDAKTGKLKWHFQTTPHDLWDWDATETVIVANADWQGSPRKLLFQANRNGFFYVWDRLTGKMLLGEPFLKHLNWASSIGKDGRPVLSGNHEPGPDGTRVCPSQDGATNWFSPSFVPATGMYYFQTFEKCSDYTKRDPGTWAPGKEYLGGSQRTAPDDKNARVLKALDTKTGRVVWELPQPGPANTWGGTLATSTGLILFGEEGGAFMAVEAATGKTLWSFQTNHSWHASPMTYMFDNKQYVAVAAGSTIVSFGILE